MVGCEGLELSTNVVVKSKANCALIQSINLANLSLPSPFLPPGEVVGREGFEPSTNVVVKSKANCALIQSIN